MTTKLAILAVGLLAFGLLATPAHAQTSAAGINNPDNLTALGHVEKYLQDTCGLSK